MKNPTFKIQATNHADLVMTVIVGSDINKMAELYRVWKLDRKYTSTLRKLELIQVIDETTWSVPTTGGRLNGPSDNC